ncbi:hypothetical protein CGH69_23990, partial [Vibrio parahaemolyticus]
VKNIKDEQAQLVKVKCRKDEASKS